ncbi:MAG: rod-binding protein [Clostridiales bacterium]|jgi:flagellar protein FlgJ|nr:rod-binding protein [Clostridiales bacterium]
MKIDSLSMMDSYQPVANDQKQTVETDAFKDLLAKAAEEKDLEGLKKACMEFETYFINTLFKEMRSSSEGTGLIEKSQARGMFEGMLDEEMSKKMSEAGGIGLADMLFKNLQKAYEAEQETPAFDIKG